MEILTIVLSGLLSLVSSGSIVLDSLAQRQIRSQVISIEKQAVRVDNSPSYQVAGGKLQKVRIANRGITIKPDLRIAVLDLETDEVNLKSKLNLNSIDGLRESLEQPASGVVKLIVTQADLNRALQSPEILEQLQKTLNRLITRSGSINIAYQLQDLGLELNSDNRLEVRFKLSRPSTIELEDTSNSSAMSSRSRELAINLKLKIQVVNGRAIEITKLEGTVNNRPMSSRLLNGFAEGISDRLNLNSLETNGILARILQLEIDRDKLKLVSFVRVETIMSQLSSKR